MIRLGMGMPLDESAYNNASSSRAGRAKLGYPRCVEAHISGICFQHLAALRHQVLQHLQCLVVALSLQ